jgi:uncharacterized protein (DUF2225 family)
MGDALWNKKIKCPFCQGEFETTRMRSWAAKIKEVDTDLGNLYEEECEYFYTVTACPHCTFAARNEEFENIRSQYEPKILEATRKIKQSGVKKPDIFGLGTMTPQVAAKRHELAIAFTRMRTYMDLGILANLCMHLVWIYRLAGDEEREKAAMAQAVKAYLDYFDKGSELPKKLGEPGVLYLIGELNRRQGLYQEARHYFEKALTCRDVKNYPKIADMARDMMILAKEQMGEEQQE